MNAVLGGNRFVLTVTVPPESVKNPVPVALAPTDPRMVVPSLASAVSETFPAGVPEPERTVTVTLNALPDVMLVLLAFESVVVVGVRAAEFHLLSKFVTLMEPNPVARSYPVPAANAGTRVLGLLALAYTSIPNPVAVVLLQFGVEAKHAMEMFPFVTSLYTQPVAGVCPTDELQFPPV
jgi:hypothetical protein